MNEEETMSNPEDFIAETCPEALLQGVCKSLRAAMESFRKDAERYRVIRQDHEGKVLPDIAMYGGRALDEYIDDRWAKAQAVGAMPAAPDAPVVARTWCPECGCAGCNGECAGDDMMGD